MGTHSRGKAAVRLAALALIALAGCGSAADRDTGSETAVSDRAVTQENTADIAAQNTTDAAEPQSMTDAAAQNTEGPDNAPADNGIAQAGNTVSTAETDRAEAGNTADAMPAAENDETEAQTEKPQPPEGWELTLLSEDWGLSFGESGTQPVGNASAEDLAWYDAYYVGDADEKVIYLTFDCGYENGNTAAILDALHRHDAPATFFVVGHFLETAPDLVKRMVEEGHTVGNHTYHHLDMPSISDPEAFRRELDDVAALFHEITGEELAPYYRPPQGKCNAENLKMAQEFGYSTIFWSLAHVDWIQDDQPDPVEAAAKLTSRIHPGAVVLLHNTSQTNAEMLDGLLTEWENMGYSFRPLSELTGK